LQWPIIEKFTVCGFSFGTIATIKIKER